MFDYVRAQSTDGYYTAKITNGEEYSGITEKSSFWVDIQQWVKDGGKIDPYVAKAPPTDEQRIDGAFPQTDSARVIFDAFLEVENQVRDIHKVLTYLNASGQISLAAAPADVKAAGQRMSDGTPMTNQQLLDWFKAKLPSL